MSDEYSQQGSGFGNSLVDNCALSSGFRLYTGFAHRVYFNPKPSTNATPRTTPLRRSLQGTILLLTIVSVYHISCFLNRILTSSRPLQRRHRVAMARMRRAARSLTATNAAQRTFRKKVVSTQTPRALNNLVDSSQLLVRIFRARLDSTV